MRAGKLDKRILIQSPPTGQDDNGEPLTTWTDFVTDTPDHKVFAAMKDLSGREFLAAQATQNEVSTTFDIAMRTGIVSSMRVIEGADIYNIISALRKGNRDLLLMCSRVV